MIDIALSDDHDIYLDSTNDLSLVENSDETPQYIKIRLLSYYGEWFLNTTLGTPYFQSILGRVFRPQEAAAIIRARILATTNVDKINEFDFNLTNRNLSISAEVQIDDLVSSVTINETI